jgi:hypothetical protein
MLLSTFDGHAVFIDWLKLLSTFDGHAISFCIGNMGKFNGKTRDPSKT